MYAVIKTGGKQYRVAEGERLDVERLAAEGDSSEVSLTPVLIVDGDRVVAAASDLAGAAVTARTSRTWRIASLMFVSLIEP